MLKILIAEDNADLRNLLKIRLCSAGYEVYEAADGLAALDVLHEAPIHLMIVDVMMPRMDGFELVAALRNANIDIPVLMLTVRDSLQDKKAGFRAGADDYLVKPVDPEELLLHIEALLRRANLTHEHLLTVGGTLLDEDQLSVSWKGKTLILRQKEFQLLHFLVSYAGRIFTRQVLMDEIWGYESETDPRTVDVHVKRLREKLVDNEDIRIETVRGLGYKVVAKK